MWIVAVAWVYVIGLVALTEPTVVAGIMTFLIYCVLPLSILFYITGSKARRARKARKEDKDTSSSSSDDGGDSSDAGDGSGGSDD
jgi:membrane protein implicated in regulation of membrane protease activity